jgi:hypothetical protein
MKFDIKLQGASAYIVEPQLTRFVVSYVEKGCH